MKTYTAKFDEDWAENKTTTEAIEKLAHTYGEAVFEWATDGKSATASISCSKCSSDAEGHTLSGAAVVEQTGSTTGDCETKGSITYKATITLNGNDYTDSKTVEGVYGDHAYGEATYTGDGKTSYTATRVCAKNENHVETATAVITSKVTKEATCTEAGEKTYTADFSEEWATDKVTTEAIDKLDHSYGTVTYTGDGKTEYKAERKCTCGDTQTATAVITSEVTKEASCAEAGVKTYTATFTEDWATDKVTTEAIEKLAHTEETIPGKAATCTETGLTDGIKCSVCDEVIKAQETIAKLDHTYGDDKTCDVCGYTKPSSSAGGTPTYTAIVESPENGEITLTPKRASKGDTVTITVEPDEGYELDTLTVTDKNGKEIEVTEKDGKYTFEMPASKVTVEATFVEAITEPTFSDVPADAYYFTPVEWAVKNGITSGTSATTFSPNAACTRAQAVTFLWRAAGSPAPKSAEMPFVDVSADAYYYDAVLWAVENGITAGTSATTFGPNITCSRAHIVTFLWRAQGTPSADVLNPFADVAVDAYYNKPVLWAVENGITAGTSATTFSPNADCTRAQIVTFLYRSKK